MYESLYVKSVASVWNPS